MNNTFTTYLSIDADVPGDELRTRWYPDAKTASREIVSIGRYCKARRQMVAEAIKTGTTIGFGSTKVDGTTAEARAILAAFDREIALRNTRNGR